MVQESNPLQDLSAYLIDLPNVVMPVQLNGAQWAAILNACFLTHDKLDDEMREQFGKIVVDLAVNLHFQLPLHNRDQIDASFRDMNS